MSRYTPRCPLKRLLAESVVLLAGVMALEQPWGIRIVPVEPTSAYVMAGNLAGVSEIVTGSRAIAGRLYGRAKTVVRHGTRGLRRREETGEGSSDGIATSSMPPATEEFGQTLEGAGSASFTGLRYPGKRMAVAFRASRSGALRQITLPWKRSHRHGAGSHGVYAFELQANGKGNFPSGDIIARTSGVTPEWAMYGALEGAFAFPMNAELTAGQTYHLVITNTDGAPRANWSSPSGLMTRVQPWDGTGSRVAVYEGGAWHPWSAIDNPWNTLGRDNANGQYCPLLLAWSDGTTTGDPNYTSGVSTGACIYDNHRAGEYIVWHWPTVTIRRVGLSVRRIGLPSEPLRYHLEAHGTTLATGILATAVQVHDGYQVWVYAPLSRPVTLENGSRYRLWFESPAGDPTNCYFTTPVCDESRLAGWLDTGWGGAQSHFISDTGRGWSSRRHADLSFSLR
ncbi:MAG: hypothetical protein ACYC7E_17020 [Armatimonadota bacterium]